MPRPFASSLEVTRRGILTGVAGAAGTVLVGCTIGPDDDRASPGRNPARASTTAARRDPDVVLAAEALAGEQATLDALEVTAARHRGLRRSLVPVIESHRAHVNLLAQAATPEAEAPASKGPPDASGRRFDVPAEATRARIKVSAVELALSTSAKRHSFAAESGAFARLLASMAASAAQHSARLRTQAPTRPGDP